MFGRLKNIENGDIQIEYYRGVHKKGSGDGVSAACYAT